PRARPGRAQPARPRTRLGAVAPLRRRKCRAPARRMACVAELTAGAKEAPPRLRPGPFWAPPRVPAGAPRRAGGGGGGGGGGEPRPGPLVRGWGGGGGMWFRVRGLFFLWGARFRSRQSSRHNGVDQTVVARALRVEIEVGALGVADDLAQRLAR